MKKTLSEINLMLKDKNISDSEKERLEIYKSQITGALFSNWFPKGFFRKFIMIIIFFIGLYGVINISMNFIFIWLILILFSPRAIGEIIHFFKKD
ncbi:MAG: hypothetical protein PHZ26_05750 [Candidatus Gracilibacteria bacterium]|nr:hypothetical protein [Candidatus Gracilibacteria bacterium]